MMTFRNKVYVVVLVVAGLLVAGSLVRYFRPWSLARLGAGLRVEEAVAFKFGRLIKERLGRNGPVLVMQLPSPDAATTARAKRQRAALARGLGEPAPSLLVVSPDQLPAAVLVDLTLRMYSGAWSKEFLAWITPHPHARAVVSFMGFPEDLPAELPAPLPPVLAVYAGRNHPAADWVALGKAFALAELRPDADLKSDPASKATPEDIFQARYTLVLAP